MDVNAQAESTYTVLAKITSRSEGGYLLTLADTKGNSLQRILRDLGDCLGLADDYAVSQFGYGYLGLQMTRDAITKAYRLAVKQVKLSLLVADDLATKGL